MIEETSALGYAKKREPFWIQVIGEWWCMANEKRPQILTNKRRRKSKTKKTWRNESKYQIYLVFIRWNGINGDITVLWAWSSKHRTLSIKYRVHSSYYSKGRFISNIFFRSFLFSFYFLFLFFFAIFLHCHSIFRLVRLFIQCAICPLLYDGEWMCPYIYYLGPFGAIAFAVTCATCIVVWRGNTKFPLGH